MWQSGRIRLNMLCTAKPKGGTFCSLFHVECTTYWLVHGSPGTRARERRSLAHSTSTPPPPAWGALFQSKALACPTIWLQVTVGCPSQQGADHLFKVITP